jgi:hypothetical protein
MVTGVESLPALGNPVKSFAASAAGIRRGEKVKLCLQEFLLSTKMVGNPLRFL